MVNLLSEETFFNDMFIELLFRLQQQRTRTSRRVVNLIYGSLSVYCQLSDEFRYTLWGKEFTTRFSRICSIVMNQKLVCVTKQINFIILEVSKNPILQLPL